MSMIEAIYTNAPLALIQAFTSGKNPAVMPLIRIPRQYVKINGGVNMKAIVYTKYGPPDALELKGVEKPEPKNSILGVELVEGGHQVLPARAQGVPVQRNG